MPPTTADIVIVGAGPTGAAAAWRLAAHGFSVVVLERGDWIDDDALRRDADDWEARSSREWHPNPNVRAWPHDDPIDDRESPIKPMIVSGVGGTTLMWTAHVPRYRPTDFRMLSSEGIGADWPLTYEELAPYYDLSEALQGTAVRPGDSTCPPRAPVQYEPLPIGRHGQRMAAAFDRLNWHWWPVERVLGDVDDGRGPCRHPGSCDWACTVGRRAAADRTLWPKALAAGVQLVTQARVTALEHDAVGRVTRAIWRDQDGKTQTISADRFLIAANGIGTPHLLLTSVSGRFPNGLANGSGLVGRGLMLHPYAAAFGRFAEPFGGPDDGPIGGIISHEFYSSDPDRGFHRGFKMQLVPPPSAQDIALGVVTGSPLPPGPTHDSVVQSLLDRSAGLTVCAEDLPDDANRVTLSDSLKLGDGRPAAALIYTVSDNSRRLLDFGLDRATEVLEAAGAVETFTTPLRQEAGFHLMGTTRMGTDAERSVVTPFCRTHEMSNLYVVDSSVFVTSAAVNPTNTAIALALRAADQIAATRSNG